MRLKEFEKIAKEEIKKRNFTKQEHEKDEGFKNELSTASCHVNDI